MKSIEFANKIISMRNDQQNEFFGELKNKLSQEDWETVVKFIGIYSMFKDVEKYNAIKNAVRDQLCEELYGHIVDKSDNKESNVLVAMYSNSIL